MNNVKERKRKLMLVLPVFVIPFLTLAFWALGGGQLNEEEKTAKGLQLNLPDSTLQSDKVLDKLGFYQKADKDSQRLEEWMRSDPYYRDGLNEDDSFTSELQSVTKYPQLKTTPYAANGKQPEDELLKKLSLLQSELNKQSTWKTPDETLPPVSTDADRLEDALQQLQTNNADDPQIGKLSEVMDKILDVQHPERVKERLKEKQTNQPDDTWPVLTSMNDSTGNGFYSSSSITSTINANAIAAVIHEDRTLVNGAVIKLRLLQDIFIAEEKIPAGTFIFGAVKLDAERLLVDVSSIRSLQSIYKVKLELHDMDGLPGIHIPGAITRDVAKESADNSLQMMELSTVDPSFKAQAATAGINTVRSLLSRKAKLIKVNVKAGYKVLLLNHKL